MIRWIFLLLLVGCASSGKNEASSSASGQAQVGQLWREFSVDKFPPDIPLQLSESKFLSFRNYEPRPGELTVIVVERIGGADRAADKIVAVLNLNGIIQPGEMFTNDCDIEGRTETAFIGLVPSTGGKNLVPRRAWRITAKRLKFEEVQAKKVRCTPEKYSY